MPRNGISTHRVKEFRLIQLPAPFLASLIYVRLPPAIYPFRNGLQKLIKKPPPPNAQLFRLYLQHIYVLPIPLPRREWQGVQLSDKSSN